jgi:5-methylcytosine-specific restriction enzyme A
MEGQQGQAVSPVPKVHTLPSRVQAQPARVATMQPGSWRGTKGQGSTARGYGYKWQQARLGYLAQHPLCVMCQAEGRVEAATVVDHKVPHRGDMARFWDSDNWQSLCKPHHDSAKQRMEGEGWVESTAPSGL